MQNTQRNTQNMQRNTQITQRNTQNLNAQLERNTQNTQEICKEIRNKHAKYAEYEHPPFLFAEYAYVPSRDVPLACGPEGIKYWQT